MSRGLPRLTTASRRAPRPGDAGETLIELLVTIAIMGVAVVTVLGAIGTCVRLADVHRKQARAGAYVRAYGEALENAVAASPTGYTNCATTATYAGVYSLAAPYAASITAVRYWIGGAWSTTCGTDSGVQRVSLRVATTDGRVAEKLDVIIRRPCRSTTDFPADAACA